MFPKVPDEHKPDKPLIANGLGVFYVLISAVYLFSVYFVQTLSHKGSSGTLEESASLVLAVCILFGGFLGLLDDWMDLKWRYKAFLPLIAAIPLASFAYGFGLRTSIGLPLLGVVDFGLAYYFVIIPLLVTIVTNTVNQLGGLNGLETVCPAIVMIGLIAISGSFAVLLLMPLAVWLILAFFNFMGKIFVGNTGSFSIGITLVSFAIISDIKLNLVISVLPFIFNSALILLTYFYSKTKASVLFDGRKLCSEHRKSLITLITYHRPMTEKQTVSIIAALFAVMALISTLPQLF